ncbi:MAG: DUF2809 domain-containing protein [Thainema sp.]
MNQTTSAVSGSRTAYRIALCAVVAVMIVLGIGSKFYQGVGESWVQGYSGDILYEVMWIALISFGWPRVPLWKIAVGVGIGTGFAEFSQLWHPPLLEAWRATFLGKLIFGVAFSVWDFVYYGIGCVVGWMGLRYLKRRTYRL